MNDEKLWTIFSEYIRLRDSDEEGFCKCFTCPETGYYKEFDCGHGISRKHLLTKYHTKNNHSQCSNCNRKRGGNPKVYKRKVNKIYGPGTWESLESLARTVYKPTRTEIKELAELYSREVKRLKAEKGIK